MAAELELRRDSLLEGDQSQLLQSLVLAVRESS